MSNRFINPYIDNNMRRKKDIIKWQLGYYNDPAFPTAPPADFIYPNPKKKIDEDQPHVTWINHCSFMIHMDGLNILTDPIWGERCSPFSFFGPKRQHNPPIDLDELPKIDLVLISHDHYDHLDEWTVKRLFRRFPDIQWVVPLRLKKWFEKRGMIKVIGLGWWQRGKIGSLTVTAVPCQHFSGRGLFDSDRTLWVGYVVESEKKRMYFVGDTGYNPYDFKMIGEAFKSMDLSLIPIGTYVPHKFMDPVHIDPSKATAIHQEVGSKLSVGMHWMTFRLSGENQHQPPYDLYLSMQEADLDPIDFRILEPGQTINW